MDYLKYLFICLLCFFELAVMIFAVKKGKPLKTVFIGAFCGLAAMLIINLTKGLTGVMIPVNPITVTISGLMGIPGVMGLIILKFVFV